MNYAIDHCEPFDGRTENPWMKAEHVGRYLFCVDFFKSIHAHKLMDAACAEGFGSQLLAESGFSVYGADINPNYVETAGKRCAGCFTVMDFERQDFPSEFAEMDGAVCFETIEHIREGGVLLKKLSRCIRDGGYLLLSFPNSLFEKIDGNGINFDPFHLRIFSREEMLRLAAAAGFVLEEEYGQSLCNQLYAAESCARHSGRLTQEEIDGLLRYDRDAVIRLAKLIGYPNRSRIEESYSYIWVLKKVCGGADREKL